MNIELDMYQTLAIAVLVLLLGTFLKKGSDSWKNSVSRHRLSADFSSLSLPVSATAPASLNFLLTIL